MAAINRRKLEQFEQEIRSREADGKISPDDVRGNWEATFYEDELADNDLLVVVTDWLDSHGLLRTEGVLGPDQGLENVRKRPRRKGALDNEMMAVAMKLGFQHPMTLLGSDTLRAYDEKGNDVVFLRFAGSTVHVYRYYGTFGAVFPEGELTEGSMSQSSLVFGMFNWKYRLDVSDLWHKYDEDKIDTLSETDPAAWSRFVHEISDRVSSLSADLPPEQSKVLQGLAEELDAAPNIENFNDIWHALYDFADANRIWVDTSLGGR